MSLPILSIVIVNWNTSAHLDACLNALNLPPRGEFEIIVVDNASTDNSVKLLQNKHPSVKLLANDENLGYAAANNQGINQATGEYVLLLNSDTLASADALAQLLAFMDGHPTVGACSPQLRTVADAPQAYAFGDEPNLIYLLRRTGNRLLFKRPLHDWSITEIREVDWVSGACCLARRDALAQVDGLDENMFMYFEDVDLCLRLRQAGWQIVYYPLVRIIHLGGQSLRKNPNAGRVYQDSLRYYYQKHYGTLSTILVNLASHLYTLFTHR